MLILTRRIGETIVIGDDVRITVLDHGKSKVRLGVNAPKEVRFSISKDKRIKEKEQC